MTNKPITLAHPVDLNAKPAPPIKPKSPAAPLTEADLAAIKVTSKKLKKPAVVKPKAERKAHTPKTFTTSDIAREHALVAKTLRARIRRNIERWSPLFLNGERHVFADNAATRKAIDALLAMPA